MRFTRITPESLMGVRDSFAWVFRCNDERAMARGHFGRARDKNDLIYLDVRNCGMTGLVAGKERTGLARSVPIPPEAVAVPGSESEAELEHDTKVMNGWRCSWTKKGPRDGVESRRATLAGQYKARNPRASRLPEEMPTRSRAFKEKAELAGRARRKEKYAVTRRWLEESGVKLRKARRV